MLPRLLRADSLQAHGPLPGCHSPAGGVGCAGPAAGWGSAVHSSVSPPTVAGSGLEEQEVGEAACLALMGGKCYPPASNLQQRPIIHDAWKGMNSQLFPQLTVSFNRGQDPGLLFTSPASVSIAVPALPRRKGIHVPFLPWISKEYPFSQGPLVTVMKLQAPTPTIQFQM